MMPDPHNPVIEGETVVPSDYFRELLDALDFPAEINDALACAAKRRTMLDDDCYVDAIDPAPPLTPAEARAAAEQHQAERTCVARGCDSPLPCPDHGTPAEDRGERFWPRTRNEETAT